MLRPPILAVVVIALSLAGCKRPAQQAEEPRPVRTVTIQRAADGETVSLTGQVRAREDASLAFRIDGRMIERPVHVGDTLKGGEIVAVLTPQTERNALLSAQATLRADEAVLTEARLTFARQQALLKGGWTPRAKFDAARQALLAAQAQVDSARAQVGIARDQLGYTVLFADAPGVVTAVGAEPGEVVRAGQMIVRVARQGGRDAVFDVPEQLMRTGPRNPLVRIALTNDPHVQALGHIRQVAPQADPVTRTYEVKVGIIDPPMAMALGDTVTGSIKLPAPPGFQVPPSALIEENGRPAVWVVDPLTRIVFLQNVEVLRYDPSAVLISHGLEPGEVVVTAGVQVLRPGQKVRLLGAAR